MIESVTVTFTGGDSEDIEWSESMWYTESGRGFIRLDEAIFYVHQEHEKRQLQDQRKSLTPR